MAMKHVSDLQVLQAVQDSRANRISGWPYQLLVERTGQVEKVCFRAMERACDRGLLDYGVSLRTAWLTDKGRALLRASGCSVLEEPAATPEAFSQAMTALWTTWAKEEGI